MVDILEIVKDRDPQEREFHQAVGEVMESVKPVLESRYWIKIRFIARPRFQSD
jgi:hypothetical protein